MTNNLKEGPRVSLTQDEYDRLNKQIQAESKGHPVVYAGRYMIEGKPGTRNMAAREATVQETWTKKIREIG